jgi:ketosteroid isomerase-like protein
MTEVKDSEAMLRACYTAFNARDLDGMLPLLHPDVVWPNGWEGGWIEGRGGVSEYWRRQWAAIDPHVEIRGFTHDAAGRVIVSVHQVVHDLNGTLLVDQVVEHAYNIVDGLIRRMEILTKS